MDIKRNDIVFVKCEAIVPNGSVQCFDRPAVVLQNDIGNTHSPTLIVVYLTAHIKKIHMPTHMLLGNYQGLYRRSMVLGEQIATISKNNVMDVVGHLRDEDVKRVNAAVVLSLALV
jgi:mRNA interferase MazF